MGQRRINNYFDGDFSMSHEELLKLLSDKGFDNGWVLTGETLILWEHDQDPPAPLTRPV
jgi:hypothetical protein